MLLSSSSSVLRSRRDSSSRKARQRPRTFAKSYTNKSVNSLTLSVAPFFTFMAGLAFIFIMTVNHFTGSS